MDHFEQCHSGHIILLIRPALCSIYRLIYLTLDLFYIILDCHYIHVLLFAFPRRWIDRTALIIYQLSDDINSHFVHYVYINTQ